MLNVGERGMLIDGLARRVGAQISFVLAGRGINHAGSGRVAHRTRQERRCCGRSLARCAGSDPRSRQRRDRAWPAGRVPTSPTGPECLRCQQANPKRADQPPGSRDRKPRASNSAPVTGRHSRLRLSASAADTYLNCPRCGLAIAQTARSRPLVHCPRCLGRARTRVELFASTLRAEQLYADGAPCADAGAERHANGATPDDGHRDWARRLGRVLLGSATKEANR